MIRKTKNRHSRETCRNFDSAHNSEISVENGGQGRVGCRGCARLRRSIFHFSLGNLRPPPIPRTSPFHHSTLRLQPLPSRPRVVASRGLTILHSIMFSRASLFSSFTFVSAFARSFSLSPLISLHFAPKPR